MIVVWPPLCTGGNKACGVSAGSLIVKTARSIRESLTGRHVGDPLEREKDPRLSTELPDRELGPCEGFLARDSLRGAPTRTRGKLARFSIPR